MKYIMFAVKPFRGAVFSLVWHKLYKFEVIGKKLPEIWMESFGQLKEAHRHRNVNSATENLEKLEQSQLFNRFSNF